MPKINPKIWIETLLNSSFFDEPKSSHDVVRELSQRGISLRGRQIGAVNTTLTKTCQNPKTGLIREEIPKKERISQEKWKYRKIKVGVSISGD